MEEQMQKLNSENWRYNLINLYYDVSLSFSDVQEYRAKAQSYFLKILDPADQLSKGSEEEEMIYGMYAVHIFAYVRCKYLFYLNILTSPYYFIAQIDAFFLNEPEKCIPSYKNTN